MTNQIKRMEDLKWDGFDQILRTPPAPGEPLIKLRDADGVNGTVVIWSEANGRWNFTDVRLQDIPPIDGEPPVRTSISGRRYTWNSEKNRWCGE
ncbi:MAG: hypothetical protein WC851_05545 [Candidatus Shapirobacteria bacterium]